MRLIRKLILIIALVATGTSNQGVTSLAGHDPVHSSYMTSDQMQVSIGEDHVNCDQLCPDAHQSPDTQRDQTCMSAVLCVPPIASIPSIATWEMKFASMQILYDLRPAQRLIPAMITPVGPPPKA